MRKNMIVMIATMVLITACSDNTENTATLQTDIATSSKTTAAQSDNILSGYKKSLDTAKAVISAAEKNEKKKEQMLQNIQ